MSDTRPIGVFDSGLGGLSCIKTICKLLPNENVVYFGDTARTPYGDKARDTIMRFAIQIVDFLAHQDVKMILIACNTVSALCTEILREKFPSIPIVSIIEPTVEHIAERRLKNVGIISTQATIKSGVYERQLQAHGIDSCSKACPVFVPLIENGFWEGKVIETVAHYYLDDFIESNSVENLVLGCTHYPFIQETIGELYPAVNFVNPSKIVVEEVIRVLKENDLCAPQDTAAVRRFFASDLSDGFLNMIRKVTQDDTADAEFAQVSNI